MADFILTSVVLAVWSIVVPRAIPWADPKERRLLWASFALHQVSAVGMVLVTKYYYEGGDMFGYQLFGTAVAARLRDDFFGWIAPVLGVIFRRPDPLPLAVVVLGGATGSMEGISALLMFVCFDSLFAACAMVGGAAFLSKVAVYRVMKAELPNVPPLRILVGCLLVPSAVFWSSGMLKEPIATTGLGMAIFGGYRLATTSRRVNGLAWFLGGSLLVVLIKPYLMVPFGLAAGTWYYFGSLQRARARGAKGRIWYALVAIALAVVVLVVVSVLAPEYAPDQVADEAMRQQVIGASIHGGSNYSLGAGAGSSGGQLGLIPIAVLTALFRPVIFEATNPLILFGALEMSLVSLFFFRAFFVRSPGKAAREIMAHPILGFCAVFTLVLSVGVGLGSTNLGTLSRYRMPLMPFFVTLLLALTSKAPRASAVLVPPPQRPLRSHSLAENL